MSFTYSRDDGDCDIPKNVDQLLITNSVEMLPAELCQARPQLQQVEFPSKGRLKTIGNYAFVSCTSLLNISIPSTLVTIGNGSFLGCKSLVEVDLMPNSSSCLMSIGRAAFNQCRSLTKVEIPSTVTIIEAGAFENCRCLAEVMIHEGRLRTIGKRAFASCFSLATITLPSTIQRLGTRAFVNCKALTEILLPDELNEIEESVFVLCSALKRVILGAGAKTIGKNAFCSCNSLIEIHLPEGLEYIGDDAFCSCKTLQRVNMASTVKTIGKHAFFDCCSLTEMFLPEGLSTAGEDVFRSCQSLERVRIPSTMAVVDISAFWKCTSLVHVELNHGVKVISHFAFRGCTLLRMIAIPASVEEIGNYSLSDCINLIEVRLQDGLKTIGICAFEGAESLSAIFIPSTVEMISTLSFSRCPRLTTVELANEMEATISDSSFAGCHSLANIEWPRKCSVSKLALKNSLLWQWHGMYCGALLSRNYPVHKLCYHASSTTVDSLYQEIQSNLQKNGVHPLEWHLLNPMRSNPFHVLGSAAQCRPDLWQVLLDSYPLERMLEQLDVCERQPLEYLVLCGIWTRDRRLVMKMALEKWMIDRVASWGAERWRSEMEAKVQLVLEDIENERNASQRLGRLTEAYNAFKQYEFLEGTSMLELALWKHEMKQYSDRFASRSNVVMTDLDSRNARRFKCGASFALPLVLSFLKAPTGSSWNAQQPDPKHW